MVNLPGTRPQMVTADFEGVSEALKGQRQIKAFTVSSFLFFFFFFKIIFQYHNSLFFFVSFWVFFVRV